MSIRSRTIVVLLTFLLTSRPATALLLHRKSRFSSARSCQANWSANDSGFQASIRTRPCRRSRSIRPPAARSPSASCCIVSGGEREPGAVVPRPGRAGHLRRRHRRPSARRTVHRRHLPRRRYRFPGWRVQHLGPSDVDRPHGAGRADHPRCACSPHRHRCLPGGGDRHVDGGQYGHGPRLAGTACPRGGKPGWRGGLLVGRDQAPARTRAGSAEGLLRPSSPRTRRLDRPQTSLRPDSSQTIVPHQRRTRRVYRPGFDSQLRRGTHTAVSSESRTDYVSFRLPMRGTECTEEMWKEAQQWIVDNL